MASLFPSHFPTEFLTLFPPGRWHLSPPILTHSFLLATLCWTPATTSKLPTCLHGSMIGKGKDGCHFRPMAEQSGLSCTTRPCSGPTDQLRMALWKKGWMHHIRHTEKNTHPMGSFSSTKRMGSPLRLSLLLWCIIYVAIVWPSLETCWQRHYIPAFDRFPYIHRLLITHVNAPIILWQVRITAWNMNL